jgi:tetratricopeptide (TPR) repeat protein
MITEAIEVLKLNVEAYPGSWNVYDSLGQAHLLNGDTEEAKKNYQRSLELNPDNKNAEQMLEKINAQ